MSNREKVVDIFLQNPDYNQKKIAKIAKLSLYTVNQAIRNYKLNITNERKPGSGRRKGTTDKMLERKVKNILKHKKSDSTRDLARKYGTSASTIHRIKVRNNHKTYTKQKIPFKSIQQFNDGIDRAKQFERFLRGKKNYCILIDDETYVKLDFSTLPGKQFYVKKRGEILPESMTTITSEKFPAKRLVWQTICECGMRSAPFVMTGTMDSKIYIKECLQNKLLPLIKKHSKPVIFWPDLAPVHYSKTAQQWFVNNNVEVVPKAANPPSIPEDRPIEKYWALCKRELKKEPKAARNDEDFKYRWNRASSRISEETIKCMMSTVRNKIKSRAQMNKIGEN